MKKYLLSLLTLTLLLCEASFTGGGIAFAANEVGNTWDEGNFTYKVLVVATSSPGKVSVKAKDGASISGALSLSSQVSHKFTLFGSTYNYDVTEIAANGFQNKTGITSLSIAGSVVTIGNYAFDGCTNISGTVSIPAATQTVGNYAFRNCSSITEFNYSYYTSGDYTNKRRLTSVGQYAYDGCSNASFVGIWSDKTAYLTSIGNYAFRGCTSMTSVSVPASVTSIGTSAFEGCSKLATVTIGTGVTSLPQDIFSGCTKLKTIGATSNVVTIPSNITSVGVDAFENCSTIVAVVIPTSVTSFGNYAFYNCSNITSVTYAGDAARWGNIDFGNALSNPCYYAKGIKFSSSASVSTSITAGSSTYKTIKAYAFYNDTCLTSVTINSSATTIKENAFNGCKNISSISIPASVTSIANSNVFSGCSKLKTVTWNPTSYTDCTSTTSTQPFYNVRSQITSFTFNSNSGFTKIPDYLCYGMTNLKNITIPRYVRTIGTNAFNSSGVENIVWNVDTIAPATYTSSSQPFMNIKSQIKTFSFGSNVKNIPNYLCYQMTGLTAVTIPNNITTVGSYIFQGCSNLENITWNATNVKSCSMYWCYPDAIRENIKSFSVGSSVTKVPSYMCYRMSGLDQFVSYATSAPSTIGTSAFTNVTKCLTILPGATGYTSSPWTTFSPGICDNDVVSGVCGAQGDNLTWSLNLTSGQLTISGEGEMADYGNSSPNYSPWYDIKNYIKNVTIEEGVTSIGKYAFYKCENIQSSVLPKSLAKIEYEAFWYCYAMEEVSFAESCELSYIGNFAFEQCTTLTHITIPENVQTFGGTGVFSNSAVQSVTWNARHCNDFTSGNGPFNSRKTAITSFTFGDAVEYIPAYLCDGMNNADFNTIAISENVTSINKNAFNGCSSLSSITWNAENCPGFSSSSNSPFYAIRANITSVEFGDNVRLIPAYLCYGMNNADFNSVTIPAKVDSIGNSAFSSCSNLHNVNYLGTDANAWASIGFYGYSSNPIYYAKGLSIGGSPLTTCTVSVSVKPYAFYNDTLITSATLDDGCVTIGASAFYGCSKLKNLTIDDSVIKFGSSAFTSCNALNKENSGEVNYLGTVNQWASIDFSGSSSANPICYSHSLKISGTTLENASITTNVKGYSFYGDTDLKTISLGEGALYVGGYAFYNCTELTTISCSASTPLDSIAASAFYNCSALKDITLPGSLRKVMSSAFYNNTALTSEGASVNFLGTANQWASISFSFYLYNPAYRCQSLKINGEILDTCSLSVSVKEGNFYNIKTLKSLSFTDGCVTIGANAFNGCSNLEGRLSFPSTVESIGNGAFQGVSDITEIFVARIMPPTIGNGNTFKDIDKTIPLYVPSPIAAANYAAPEATYWNEFNIKVGGYCGAEGNEENVIWAYNPTTGALNIFGTGAMEDYALNVFAPWYDLRASITSVSIGEGITRIGVYAFRDCAAMTSAALPASITEIGDRAFDGCTGLASYTYAGTVNNWLNITFEYFSSNPMYYVHKFYVNGSEEVTNLVIPYGMTTVKDNAFRACTGLTSLSLPASITTLTGAFTGCTGLTSYSYAGSVADWLHISITNADGNPMKYVHKFMVNGNEEVTDLVIPEGITSISQFAFNQCSGLTSVTIPASLTSIGLSAFSSCSNIADVNYLGTISQWCAIDFENNIANPAWFSQQLSLNGEEQINIYLPDELSEIKNYVFGKNTTAATISVNNSTTIQAHAFDNCTAEILYRGNTGGETADGLSWSLVDGLLTISGTGAMQNYSETTTPWYPYRSAITGIVVDEGVTAIGSSAFVKTSATSVLIASTVGSIGDWAFSECTSLTQITCNSETPPTIMDGKDGPSSYSSRTFKDIPVDIVVMVPIGSTSAYQASRTSPSNTTSGWARFTNYHEPAVTDIDLIDSENNGVTLTTYNGQEMTVHLTRSLISASYNTICLPFAMTAAQVESAFGAECDIEELTRASYADGNLKLFFTKRTAIEAGKPYLIQPQSDVANPTIAGVTIDNTSRPSEFEGVTFTGIFSPTALADSESLLFLGIENTLYMSSGGQMKGLRGYFELTTPQAQAAARRSARIILHEEGATGIESQMVNGNCENGKFIKDGQLFILRDGKTYNAQGALIK